LDASIQPHFDYDSKRSLHVAPGLTAEKFELHKAAASYVGGSAVFVRSAGSGVSITNVGGTGARRVLPSRSYAQ
jgi:hypothetical protein